MKYRVECFNVITREYTDISDSFDLFEDAYNMAGQLAITIATPLQAYVEKRHPLIPKNYADSLGKVELFQISNGSETVKVIIVRKTD